MRFLSFLFLIAFLAAVGLFAWQNQQEATVTFFEWGTTTTIAILVGVAYVLGMLSGWSVVGMVRRSFNTVADDLERRQGGF